MRIRAVLIDFDDTIAMTQEVCFHFENQVLADMGLPPMDREVYRRTWGPPVEVAIALRVPGIDLEEYQRRFAARYEDDALGGPMSEVTDENLGVLDALRGRGIALGLLTSRRHREMGNLLECDHPLRARLDYFYGLDDVPEPKPSPRAFEPFLRSTGIAPADCVYVGDAVNDAAAATGAGLHFIANLENGTLRRESFEGYPVLGFIERFENLLDLIDAI